MEVSTAVCLTGANFSWNESNTTLNYLWWNVKCFAGKVGWQFCVYFPVYWFVEKNVLFCWTTLRFAVNFYTNAPYLCLMRYFISAWWLFIHQKRLLLLEQFTSLQCDIHFRIIRNAATKWQFAWNESTVIIVYMCENLSFTQMEQIEQQLVKDVTLSAKREVT